MKDLRLLQTKKSPRKEMTSLYQRMLTFLVGVTGFEPAASTSQMSRATNCATPRFYVTMILYHSSVCLSTKINPLIRTIIFPKPIYSPLERYTNLNKSLANRQQQQSFLFYLLYEQLYFSANLLSLAS